eukprot:GHRR01020473.1.p3 GENE.GHRR01020473.1~~GHRR01020473.1.p3  ORF type:complete len:122 (+),score=65.40 GHRR01020473.1:792-1157(+)
MLQICGYYCVHPYNPDWTAQHKAACSEHMAAVAWQQAPAGSQFEASATFSKPLEATAAIAAEVAAAIEPHSAEQAVADGDAAGTDGADADNADEQVHGTAAAVDAATNGIANKLADTHISS